MRTVIFLSSLVLLKLVAVNLVTQQSITTISEDPSLNKHYAPISLGVRPMFLIDSMKPSELKNTLQNCTHNQARKSNFSIGHRGAPLQFPEHTKESYLAAARQGAGIIECDVTFTQDRQLVCRHSQCDLHTTTDILSIPALAKKCTQPFIPANPQQNTPAQAQCCTSDITLAEFKTLRGKMDAFDPTALTVKDYMVGTAGFRTDLYASSGTVMTLKENIQLLKQLNIKHTPELKAQ